jgi:hypothetical protein
VGIGLIWNRIGLVTGSCENCYEPSGSMKFTELNDQFNLHFWEREIVFEKSYNIYGYVKNAYTEIHLDSLVSSLL